MELGLKEHTLVEKTRVCVILGGWGSDPINTVTKATSDYGETTQSTGRRPGEEPGPGTSPETLAKFRNILGFGLLILRVDKAI